MRHVNLCHWCTRNLILKVSGLLYDAVQIAQIEDVGHETGRQEIRSSSVRCLVSAFPSGGIYPHAIDRRTSSGHVQTHGRYDDAA